MTEYVLIYILPTLSMVLPTVISSFQASCWASSRLRFRVFTVCCSSFLSLLMRSMSAGENFWFSRMCWSLACSLFRLSSWRSTYTGIVINKRLLQNFSDSKITGMATSQSFIYFSLVTVSDWRELVAPERMWKWQQWYTPIVIRIKLSVVFIIYLLLSGPVISYSLLFLVLHLLKCYIKISEPIVNMVAMLL